MRILGKGFSRAIPFIGGALDSYFTWDDNKERGETIMNRRGAIGETIGSGVGSTVGAILGSFIPIPVVGTIVGSIIGDTLGKLIGRGVTNPNIGRRSRLLKEYKNEIINRLGKQKFGLLDVHYDPKEMRLIRDALKDGNITEGEIPEYLVKKIIAKGGKNTILAQGKFARGGFIKGKSHSEGGTLIEAEGGEVVGSRQWVKENPEMAAKVGNGEKVTPPKVKKPAGDIMTVRDNWKTIEQVGPSKLDVKHGKIELGGTINMNANGQNIDISSLLQDKEFVSGLQRVIATAISQDYNKKDARFKGTGV